MAKTSGLPQKGKWPPRGTGTTVLTYPCSSQPCFGGSKGCAQVTGKAGENGQHSGAGRQLTLDKTVGSRVWRHTQGLSKLRLDLGWGSGKPGSGVAIEWVTGRSRSSAINAKIFDSVVTRSTTAEFQHNDMMMRTNVQNDLRHEMALEMWIVSVHEKSEQL